MPAPEWRYTCRGDGQKLSRRIWKQRILPQPIDIAPQPGYISGAAPAPRLYNRTLPDTGRHAKPLSVPLHSGKAVQIRRGCATVSGMIMMPPRTPGRIPIPRKARKPARCRPSGNPALRPTGSFRHGIRWHEPGFSQAPADAIPPYDPGRAIRRGFAFSGSHRIYSTKNDRI